MSDEADVNAAFDAFDVALESGDIDKIAELFSEEASITVWGSALPERAVGADELRTLLSRLFESIPERSIRRRFSERRIHVAGDVAWVNAAGTVSWDAGSGREEKIPYRLTAIFVRTDDGWRWHTHHGSRPTTS